MIDQVSHALPEMTWLTSLKQVGYDVTIEGRCLALTYALGFCQATWKRRGISNVPSKSSRPR